MNSFYEQRPEGLFIGGMTDYPVAAHVHTMAEVVVVISPLMKCSTGSPPGTRR